MKLSKQEINRKLLHVLSGSIIPASIFFLPFYNIISIKMVILILGICLLFSLLFEGIRFNNSFFQKHFFNLFGSFLRNEESKKVTGSTYIFASSFLCSVLFMNHLHIAFIVLNLFILGDAVASIVGIKLGKIKIKDKTIEGSIACFCLCFIFLKFIYPFIPNLLDKYNNKMNVIYVIFISFLITFFELFPIKIKNKIINDNLTAPIFSGLLILLAEIFFIG